MSFYIPIERSKRIKVCLLTGDLQSTDISIKAIDLPSSYDEVLRGIICGCRLMWCVGYSLSDIVQEQQTLVEGSYQERVWETLALAETRNCVIIQPRPYHTW